MRRVLLAYELRMLLRDTRTVLIAVVAPLLLFPAAIWLMMMVERSEERRLEETVYRYAVAGDSAAWAARLVESALALPPTDTAAAPARFARAEAPDEAADEAAHTVPADPAVVDSILGATDLHVVVRGLSAAAWREIEEAREGGEEGQEGDAARSTERAADDPPGPDTPVVVLEYRVSSDFERRAATLLHDRLRELRRLRRDSSYRARGFPVDPGRVAELEPVNTASAEREAGAFLGLALTPFLMLLMLTGGSIVAVDAISGEKERGTLETLLTTAATRSEIVQAKLAAVAMVGLAVAVVNLLNLLVYVVLGVLDLPARFAVDLSALDLLLLLVLLLPVTVLVAGALLLLSGYAKSYKEYQIYFFPLFLVLLVPSLAATLPGMELRSVIALVPISGVGVAVREVMVGERDWPFLLLAFLSTGAMAWWLARLTERALSTERLVAGAELDEADLKGGAALFPRHVLRWFGVMWVVFFIMSAWIGTGLGIRGQLVLNLVVLFFGGSLLMIRRYRLPIREALALRRPAPAVWLAVLVGAPSALVVAAGLASFVDAYVFPVPDRMIEAFGEYMGGTGLPLWQVVLFLAVMPGIFEEIAFRGVLVYGLRRKLRPLALCLAVGAIFGLFHVSLFRIVPTAYLGVVLTAVVLLTGSIFPAMLWHALNNAIGVIPSELGWIEADTVLPTWVFLEGVVGLATSFWILWRTRRPYPGLKKARGHARSVERKLHPPDGAASDRAP